MRVPDGFYRLILSLALFICAASCRPVDRSSTDEAARDTASAATMRARQSMAAEASSLVRQQQSRWQQASIHDYRFTLMRESSGSPDIGSPVIVTVRGSKIVLARYASVPDVVTIDPEKQKLPTIDSLFTLLRESIARTPDSLSVRYDLQAGFPYSIFVDRKRAASGDEIDVEIKDFTPLRPISE